MVSIQAVVIKILEGIAVLKNGSEEFLWPLHYLPVGIKIGDAIVFQTARPASAKRERDGRSEGALESRATEQGRAYQERSAKRERDGRSEGAPNLGATERGASLQKKDEDQYAIMRKLLEEMIN